MTLTNLAMELVALGCFGEWCDPYLVLVHSEVTRYSWVTTTT